MNSTSGPKDDDDAHSESTAINLSDAKLDVYQHDRLAITERAARSSVPQTFSKRRSTLLKAFYYWTHSRL